jgi:hypothetical protein
LDNGHEADKFRDEVVKPVFARIKTPSLEAREDPAGDAPAVEVLETWYDHVSTVGQIGRIVFFDAERKRALIHRVPAGHCLGDSATRQRPAGGWREASSKDWHIWSY